MEIVGSIRLSSDVNSFTPDNDYKKREVFSVNPGQIASEYEMMTLLPFYVVQEPYKMTRVEGQPLPIGNTIDLPNNHFMYAIIHHKLTMLN